MSENSGKTRLTITETDNVNNPLATYIYTESTRNVVGEKAISTGRVDVVPAQQPCSSSSTATAAGSWVRSLGRDLAGVFLPAGYPHSVSEDYLEYQIYDSIQAFASSIAGLLSSRAVLQGVGVGDSSATPTAALLLQIAQETSARLATILFAHRLGTALEPECKRFRFAADIFNDVAMVLDCLSPAVPVRMMLRGMVVSAAGVLRALCGVAAGGSKASLSAHFARAGNIGELNAKDSSQETIISLLGMLTGSLVITHITSPTATWTCLLILLVVHLTANYRAVRAVQMRTLNRQRANIVFSSVFEAVMTANPCTTTTIETAPTPAAVACQERIFEWDGVLRWYPPQEMRGKVVGYCRIGVSVRDFLSSLLDSQYDGNNDNRLSILPILTDLFSNEPYILYLHPHPRRRTKQGRLYNAVILLKQTAATSSSQDILKSWAHALLAVKMLQSMMMMMMMMPEQDRESNCSDMILEALRSALEFLNGPASKEDGADGRRFSVLCDALRRAGWDLDTAALETRGGHRRVHVSSTS